MSMECPNCHHENRERHKYCSQCGHCLGIVCSQCQAINPTDNVFCYKCGDNIIQGGLVSLARSGLITRVNQKALSILGYGLGEMLEKPFSSFMDRADKILLHSHLNELLNSSEQQIFEANLNSKNRRKTHVLLRCRVDPNPSKTSDTIHIIFTEIADKFLHPAQIQHQQELLSLIFTITHNIATVGDTHLANSIENALKKICLYSRADRCFIYGINHALKRLELVCQWGQPSAVTSKNKAWEHQVSASKIKCTVGRLLKEKLLVAQDLLSIEQQEGRELREWYQIEQGATICYLIYFKNKPVGIIGIVKMAANDEWSPTSISLLKFFGDFIGHRLAPSSSYTIPNYKAQPLANRALKPKKIVRAAATRQITREVQESSFSDLETKTEVAPKKVQLSKLPGDRMLKQQQAVLRDDDLVVFMCPQCNQQETVPEKHFTSIGYIVGVTCHCGQEFAAVLEKRRFLRKAVHLDGFFLIIDDEEPAFEEKGKWGPMIVKDISKKGIRFRSDKISVLNIGDRLMVRFNLNDSANSVILKQVQVKSVSQFEAGAQFEGADEYDIALGFYLV